METIDNIEWTFIRYREFLKAYGRAKSQHFEEFKFLGKSFKTKYAKHLIGHLEPKFQNQQNKKP